MQIVAPRSAKLSDLLAELGVRDPERAAELVAKHNALEGPNVAEGRVLSIPAEVASALVHNGAVEGAAPMKTLGIHAVSALLDAAREEGDPNGLGRLLALAAIHLPDLVPSNVERGRLTLKLPLSPGRFRLPLSGDQSLEIEVSRRTTITVNVDLIPTKDGPKIGRAEIESSAPLRILNPAEVSVFRDSAIGALANAFFAASLERMEIDSDGGLTLGAKIGPARITIPSVVLPRIELDATRLLAGKLVRDRSLFMSLPDRIDPTLLLGAMGAKAEKGSFELSLTGKQGVVDVGERGILIRGRTSPVVARIEGDFRIDERGRIAVRFEARTNVKDVDAHLHGTAELEIANGAVSGRAHVDGRARPTKPIEIEMPIRIAVGENEVGAKVGDLHVAHDRERMNVRSGRRWFGIEQSVEKRMLLSLGNRTSIHLDRDAIVSGDIDFRLGANGLAMSSRGVEATFDLGEARIESDGLSLRLAEGSSVECNVSSISLDERGGLRLDDLSAGFQIGIEAGRFEHGLLGAAIDSGRANRIAGRIVLRRDESGAALDTEATLTLHAIPKAAKLLGVGVEKSGTMRARITRDAIELAPSEGGATFYLQRS